MVRHQTPNMMKLMGENDKCELCGSRRSLEVHHIIPVSFGGPEDDINNMIVVCCSCHTKLTPRSILTKRGIENTRYSNIVNRIQYKFYKECNELFESPDASTVEIFDVFDRVINEALESKELKGETA